MDQRPERGAKHLCREVAVHENIVCFPCGGFLHPVDGPAVQLLEPTAASREELVGEVTVEEDSGLAPFEDRDTRRDLVTENHVELCSAQQDQVEGDVDHTDVGPEGVAQMTAVSREPVPAARDLQAPICRLSEAVARVVVGGEQTDSVAAGFEGESSVHHQPFSTSYPKVWVDESHAHHQPVSLSERETAQLSWSQKKSSVQHFPIEAHLVRFVWNHDFVRMEKKEQPQNELCSCFQRQREG